MDPKADVDIHADICIATPDDSALLSALAVQTYTEAFGPSMSAADLASHLKTNLSPEHVREMLHEDVFLLARVEGETVAFVQFGDAHIDAGDLSKPSEVQPGDKEIRRLYVSTAFQNLGVGAKLMDAALNHPWLAGTTIFLDVWEDNTGAQRFYRRYGFERVGERAFRVTSGEVTGVDFVMVRVPKTSSVSGNECNLSFSSSYS